MKKCTKCGEEKPATLEYFYADKHRPSGFQSDCKKCRKQTSVLWRKSNLKKFNEQKKKHKNNNAEKYRNYVNNRRARKFGNGHEHYAESDIFEVYGYNCYLCDMPINLDAPRKAGEPGWRAGLQIEHFVAISQGGSDTLENVRPSHGWCNLAKGTK